MHQASFVKSLLSSYGLDGTSKPLSAVTIALPTPDDAPPDAVLLKSLQKYAGEFNWLATRTRPDLAYFTSLIASSMKAHGEWSLQLCKKVLRYLLGTIEHGLLMKALSSPEKHVVSYTHAAPAGASLCPLSSCLPLAAAAAGGAPCAAGPPPPAEPIEEGSGVDELWDAQQLVAYSDAGFGGVGTRAQTGVLVL